MPAPEASVMRAGEALCFTGALSRAHVAGLWKQLPATDGVRRIDLTQVSSVDSAGLALLALLTKAAPDITIDGSPAGLSELRSAYRLDAGLGFAA